MKIEHPDLEDKILNVLGFTKHGLEWYWNSWYEDGLLVIETSYAEPRVANTKFSPHPYYYDYYTQEDLSICVQFVIPPEHQQFFDKLVQIVKQKDEELYHTITTNLASCDKEG